MPVSEVFNEDCMIGMSRFPDGYFDLAIVDPPYGINIANSPRLVTDKGKKGKDWDVAPTPEYFDELFRVSKNQIIWGGNYFALRPTKGYIFWYKRQPAPSFADGEFAWTSFDRPAKCFDYRFYGNIEGAGAAEKKLHPTQKPIALYKWLLHNYGKLGDKILDTHMGSQSSRIAAYDMGFDYWGFELDPEYFADANRRFTDFISQQKLFV